MFFKNKDKIEFQRMLPTERLHSLFRDVVFSQIKSPKPKYIKSIRSLRFERELFHFEIAWDQHRRNTRYNDSGFQVRCSLFSKPYRKWEKKFYDLPKSLVSTPIGGLSFRKIDGFDATGFVGQSYHLNFKNRKQLASVIAKNIDSHFSNFFSSFENWDDNAISKLEETQHRFFPQTIPLVITDFLILQNRLDEAWTYLDTHDQWYKKFIKQEENDGEGLNDMWGPPYYHRKNKLESLLGLG